MARTSYAIGLGSNRPGRHGGPRAEVAAALAELGRAPARLIGVSPLIATAPLGPSKRRFVNAAAILETDEDPARLLRRLKAIEQSFGRRRGQSWAARVIDLDLLLWSEGAWASPGLTVPHQLFRARRFVLDPLVRVAPHWRDPVSGLTVRQLRARLTRPTPAPRGGRVGP
ncbi:MAG: 2-amino-4-hydroxy-6-hydroxymethyldihydropteridine diphosphokinase [Sphingomonas sp.]|uniref:2-amino-4-hydroxy-6- hydroxymethyldihydropteridine diphosphokinase n=1 Tax=Sphingomonas sp. TaxID=28214 RepID=UPI001B23535B|nr:2-amino-4-hydroxy-6-hydroxymethyldihydropteridine diphosphokinase [Sphingomonas sp.]MBO9621230.1 2-amino-4-hydroxy-6-hydroxymethyldihydropteridine diphosphokinase [Sphingomonas sp.]